MKFFTAILLIWYLAIRWVMLANTNQLSIEWLFNPSSLLIAFISIGYLSITLFSKERNKTYYMLSSGLFLYNLTCVGLMTFDYLKDSTTINLFYLILDILITTYYILNISLCYQESFFFIKILQKLRLKDVK